MKRVERWEQHRIRTALIALGVIAVGLFFVVHRQVPFQHHYTIKAEVRNSTEIRVGSPVRIAGVNVGKVTKLGSHGKNGVITMQIEDAGRPVHADAQVHIRQRIALEGNQFVDLAPGSPSAKAMPDGGTIPASQTTTPVQLDQVLGTLDASTRDRLVTTLDQYGLAVSGKGGDGLRGSIKYWKPAYSGAALVNEAVLGKRLHDLSNYIGDAGTVADAIDSSPSALRSLVAHFDDTTAAFASERAALGQSVQQLPGTLSTGRESLRKVDAMLPAVDRLATDLRPVVRAAPDTIDQVRPFLEQVRLLARPQELGGLAGDLRPTISDLATLDASLVPLLGQLRLASSCQDNVILPFTRMKLDDPDLPVTGTTFEEATRGTLPGLAGESRSGDANGQWFSPVAQAGANVVALGDDQTAVTALPVLGVNPRAPEQRPPLRPNVTCETQEKPDLRSEKGAPPPQQTFKLDTPQLQARWLKAQTAAIEYARKLLDQQGLGKILKVSDKPLTLDQLHDIVPRTKGALDALTRKP